MSIFKLRGEIMEEWRQKLYDEAEQEADAHIAAVKQRLDKAEEEALRVLEVKHKIIAALREEPKALFGSTGIYVRSENYLVAHDVAKELGIKLDRTAESDGFNYKGNYKGVSICIYGAQKAANCIIVPKKVLKEEIVYETICE